MKFLVQLRDTPVLWPIYMAAIGWLAFITITQLWPASFWLDVRSVHVNDSQVGHKITMNVDRIINRNFYAVWSAQVRQVDADGSTSVHCTSSAASQYRVGSDLPYPTTLDWWTDGRCGAMGPGRYMVITTWNIESSGFLPAKRIQIDSNTFEVLP